MKTIIQAFFCSLLIHIIFFSYTFGWGYIKAKFYKSNITNEYDPVVQTNVVFAFIGYGSPLVFLGIWFIGITILCAFIIILIKKYIKPYFKTLSK
ncbi:hypothetical protein AMD00_02150 [Viridibacillus arvi]|uniref:Uncharacterized protein n=1 Tax=Viridibacillus arvi TaxID=263475 RepID=A0A0M0LJU3_9BACL|nr:hypothetical protein AMD00_02150 [Viridibacillus arvi]